MANVFYWLVNMSLIASLTGTVVWLIGKVRRLPRRVVGILWLVPLLRLWLPFGVAGKYGIISLWRQLRGGSVPWPGYQSLVGGNFLMEADHYFPLHFATSRAYTVFSVAGTVWLVVALALMLTVSIVYFTTKAVVKDARHLQNEIYLSDKVSAPMVFGVFRPRIVLPCQYPSQQLHYILLHERAHIKRCDNLRRLLAVYTACLHWFNPLVWLFLSAYLKELELACDETVMRHSDAVARKEYAKTLLQCAAAPSLYMSAFGGVKVRVRIERILAYKKLSALSVIGSAGFVIAVLYLLLTN